MAGNSGFHKNIKELEGGKRIYSWWSKFGIGHLSEATDFVLPTQTWDPSSHILLSILLASLLINVLSLAFPLALLQVYDRIIPNVAINTLVLLVIGVVIALIIEASLRIARSYVGGWADAKFEHVMGCQAYRHLVDSPSQVFESQGSGLHLKQLNSLAALRDFYAGQAIVSLADIPFILVLLALIAYIGGWVVLVPIVTIILFVTLTLVNADKLQKILVNRKEHEDHRFNFIIETLNNIHTVKAVTMEAQMMRRYERLQKAGAVNDHDMSVQGSLSMSIGYAISQSTVVLVVAFGSMLVIKGDLTIGGLAACTLLSGRSLQPLNNLVNVWTRLQAIKISREELDEVLSMPAESALDAPEIGKVEGRIELKNVNFRYSEESPYIFKNLNFTVEAKETVGIAGSGFSGRSTLLWLILGILRPESGEVLIDGKNISQYQMNSLREQIGYLPSNGVLFNGTILENLTMFEPMKYQKAAQEAVEAVGLENIIASLPKGYDTYVGDQAIEALSRGIKQRIAIARALVRKPPVVLFDEANMSIDIQGDMIIKKLMVQLAKHTTLILVSHRPSILEVAKKVYALEDGTLRLVS